MYNDQIRQLLVKSFIIAVIALVVFLFGLSQQLVLTCYSNGIYPIISTVLRVISAIFPFAIGDLLYVVLILFGLLQLAIFFKKIKKNKINKTHRVIIPLKLLHMVLLFYISFKLLWGLNYARPSITQQLNIGNERYDVKQLVALGNYFVAKLNALQPNLNPRLSFNIHELHQKAVIHYQKMERINSFFAYPHPSIKPVLNDWLVSKMGIEGYYNPLSGEANVNMKLPAWVLPFVTCHEISHQLGVAREDEANLVAYLVGINSEDINFQYSVNYNMLRYILLEIRIKSPEDYLKLRNRISPALLENFKIESDFWKRYNGQMSGYMGVAFDKFLKLNNQKRGIKSYQNIVIWLWNYHKKEII